MSATNFKTDNNTYRKLMGNGLIYKIPPFQRDYSWTNEEWEDLWQDILETIKEGGEPAHYMGYLVLQPQEDEKQFDVIDGQQRLTTLSIIVLAALKNLKYLVESGINAEQNRQRIDQIRSSYIGYLDPVTLISRSKLILNHNNNFYFQNHLIPLSYLPKRGFKASEYNLSEAFEWFEKQISNYVKAESDKGVAVAKLVDKMSDKLFFTVISVKDELNAYKVFETLNARGVRLSSTDLLKNYLFSILNKIEPHERELKNLEDRWERIVGRLGGESFSDFLRVHWNSRYPFVRQTDLFKAVRKKINNDRRIVFELLRDMEEDIEIYLAITQPDASGWSALLKNYAYKLKLFAVRQPLPLIIAAKHKLNNSDFESFMRCCVVICFRYNVIALQPPHEQERVCNTVAQKIFNNELTSLNAILQALKPIYLDDELFNAIFAEKIFDTRNSRNSRIVRYILCQLEKQISRQEYDFDSSSFNIEHILPQKVEDGWNEFSDEELDVMTYRLGNMTLLEKAKNQMAANAEYEAKRVIFAESGFEITRKMAQEYESWTAERIAHRQQELAKQAKSIWRIAQLS